MKVLMTILLATIHFSVWAQPGYVRYNYNLNDLTEEIANQNKQSPNRYRLTVFIDSTTTKFSKLKLLEYNPELHFNIKIKKLPKKFHEFYFKNLKELYIECNGVVTNISAFRGFRLAEKIEIQNFVGKSLPSSLSQFDSLTNLNLWDAKRLRNCNVISKIKNLIYLDLNCANLDSLPNFNNHNVLQYARLYDVGNTIDLQNLSQLLNLYTLHLNFKSSISEIPLTIPQSVMQLTLIGDIQSLKNLKNYPNLQLLNVRNTLLENFNADLKFNTALTNIQLDVNTKMKYIDGVYTCKNLEYLYIGNMEKFEKFEFKNLDLKKGLTIQNTGIKIIEPIEKIYSLKYVYLKHNPYLKIKNDSKLPERDIYDNGLKL